MSQIQAFLNYFFIKNPGSDFSYYIEMFVLAGLLICGGLVFGRIYKNRKKFDFAFKRLFKKVSKLSVIFGTLLIVLTLLRFENIPYFSMRIWLYITFATILYLTYKYTRSYFKVYPLERENVERNRKVKKVVRYSTSKRRH